MSGDEARIVDDMTARAQRMHGDQERCDLAKSTEAPRREHDGRADVHSRATLAGWTMTDETMLVVNHPTLGKAPPCDDNGSYCLPKVSSRVLLPHGADPSTIAFSGKGCVLVALFRSL